MSVQSGAAMVRSNLAVAFVQDERPLWIGAYELKVTNESAVLRRMRLVQLDQLPLRSE